MAWINLEGMNFTAPVGVSEEERKNKNKISVNLFVRVDTKKASYSDSINDTVDYEALFLRVKYIIEKGASLLETLSAAIGETILEEFSQVSDLKVIVTKHHPPFKGECEKVSVKMRFKR